MQPIRSGPSRERVLRTLLVTSLASFFAIAFLLDGYFGYQTNNLRQLVKSLGLDDASLPEIDEQITGSAAEGITKNVTPGISTSQVIRSLGDPAIRSDGAWYYVGPGGHLRIDLKEDRVLRATWLDGVHSETDIAMQQAIGWGLGVVGGGFLLFLINVLMGRTVLDDDGLKKRGRPLVPWHAMEGLEASGRDGPETMTLSYTPGMKLRLDRYHVAKLGEIVDAIRTRKGFTSPQTSPDRKDPVDSANSEKII